jgi:O-antigen/teichoic acid export membrane protein
MAEAVTVAAAGAAKAKDDPAAFMRRAGPLVLARFFTAAMTFAIPLVLARKLSLDDYGTYKQLFLVSQTLFYVLPFGMTQALYFFVPRSSDPRPFFGQTLAFITAGGMLAATLLVMLNGPLAAYFSNPAIADYRWVQAAYLAFLVGAGSLEASLTTQGRTKHAALAYLVFDCLRAVCMIFPALLGYGLKGTMIAMVGFAAIRFASNCTLVSKSGTGPLFDPKLFKQQLLYAAPFGAAMLLAIPQQYAHQYAVSAMVTPAMFALYSVGCFQLPIVDLLYTPTSEVLMVQIGELEKVGRVHEAAAAYRAAAGRLSLVFFAIAAFLCSSAHEFIGALFGQKFIGAVPMFQVCVLGIVLAVFPMDGVLRARNETRFIFLSYLVKALVTVPLVFFLVKTLGMMGGILSWVFAEVVGKLMLFSRLPRALSTPSQKVTAKEIIPVKEFLQASAAAIAGAIGLLLMRGVASHALEALPPGFAARLAPLAVDGTVFGIAYLVVLYSVGVRPQALLASLRGKK